MGFQTLAPARAGKADVKAGVLKLRGGALRLSLVLSASVVEKLGAPERVDVMAGDGEHFGQIVISPDEEGAFALGSIPSPYGANVGRRLLLPVFAGVADRRSKLQPCVIRKGPNPTELVIALPAALLDLSRTISRDLAAVEPARPRAQAVLGDPPPGRSALDAKRRGA